MKEREIIKGIRAHLDSKMSEEGYRFDNKTGSYLKFDETTQLYYRISLLFVNYVANGTNHKSKYLEVFLEIYHSDISKMIHDISIRGQNLDSFFYFKVIGNMLSDIVLNTDWSDYLKRNNHNYFKLEFVFENDIAKCSKKLFCLLEEHALPFFEKFDALDKIAIALDRCYDKTLVIHNINSERLLVVVALLFYFNDPQRDEKIKQIESYLAMIRHDEALLELTSLKNRFLRFP